MKTYLHFILILASLMVLFGAPAPARAAGTTITVNGLADDATVANLSGNLTCDLREAAAAVTTNTAVGECPGGSASEIDTIAFDLPGAGVQMIPMVAYLLVNSPVIIDGTSDPDYAGSPVVRLDGADALIYGLELGGASDGSTVKGLMITRFYYGNLLITSSDGTQVTGNYIGTDGSNDLGGKLGVSVNGGAGVIVGGPTAAERNIITGHENDIRVGSSATGPTIQGNYIGVFANGTSSPAGSLYGVSLSPTCCSQGGSFSTIGGLGPGEGNVIAGHTASEVLIASGWHVTYGHLLSDNNTVQGNIIGLNAAGTAAPVAAGDGIQIVNSDDTLIEGNSISGKSGSGVVVKYDTSWGASVVAPTGTVIRSNWIGTSADGLSDLGNGNGVYLKDADSTTVGGNNDFTMLNVISGNAYGIRVEGGSGNVVDTNWIGTGADGTTALPNSSYGIHANALTDVSRNWVANSPTGIYLTGSGGFSAAADNCLTGNTTAGLDNTTGSGVTFENSYWGASSGPSGQGPGTGDAVSIDVDFDPFLTSAPAACVVQLLQNASFEIDDNLDKRPDGWTLKNFAGATDKRDCSKSKNGACSLKFVGNGKSKSASQTILQSGTTGDDFDFSLWSKAKSMPSSATYRLQVKFYDGTTVLGTFNKNFSKGTHGFKQVSDVFTAPGPYTKVTYKIIFKAPSGTAWFDSAGLSLAP